MSGFLLCGFFIVIKTNLNDYLFWLAIFHSQ